MNFFKSVFSDDPDPDPPEQSSGGPIDHDPDPRSPSNQHNPSNDSATADGWSFGGLIKTLATKSESVIETYSRDLKEFGTGLKREIEVAQGSLESVGHVIDEFGNTVLKGTAQIISQGKEAVLADGFESDSSDSANNLSYGNLERRYSRFQSQVRAIQGDVSTYCEEPEDLDDFNKWKSGFVLEERKEEIDNLCADNGAIESIYKRVVPCSVDHETFWCRYFYKVFKFKQAEDVRAKLVKRAISREEEELSWDVDDSDRDGEETKTVSKANTVRNSDMGGELVERSVEEAKGDEKLPSGDTGVHSKGTEKISHAQDSASFVNHNSEESSSVPSNSTYSESGEMGKKDSDKQGGEGSSVEVPGEESSELVHDKSEKNPVVGNEREGNVVESSGSGVAVESAPAGWSSGRKAEDSVSNSAEKFALEAKAAVSSQTSQPEEDDLGWDEIEDLSSIEEKKATHGGSPNRAELRKRLSAAEEVEDLSWDIEDDDEPVKA